jgi:outer membrane protein assembly factor BamA
VGQTKALNTKKDKIMSFWKSLSNITGKVEDSTARRKQIPDNTFLQARIDSVELKIHDFKEYFKVTWVVESDEFKGFRVSQNIKFDVEDNAKSLAALNMVARLFILAGKPLPQDKPGVIDWIATFTF